MISTERMIIAEIPIQKPLSIVGMNALLANVFKYNLYHELAITLTVNYVTFMHVRTYILKSIAMYAYACMIYRFVCGKIE